LSPEEFRYLLAPHLAACALYMVFCAAILVVGTIGDAAGVPMRWLPGVLLGAAMLGGLVADFFR
jgi:hypothetical protein